MKRLGLSVLLVVFTLIVIISPAFAAIGSGKLNVLNADDVEDDTYYVTPCNDYTIRIEGIPEFASGEFLTIKIGWTDTDGVSQTTFFYDVEVVDGDVEVIWHVPENAKICTTCTVHYRQDVPEYVAVGLINTDKPAHMHIVPENPLGIIGSILALFAGLGIFILTKSKSSNRAVLEHP